MSNEKYIWTERYRPKTLDEYVWADASQKTQVENWVREKHLPNLLLSGSPGIGKTTLAKCLLNELHVHSSDVRYVNGSHTNGVDDIRALSRFAETMPSGDFRYVVLDEADYITPNGQAALRNMIEEYNSICRWILTCNYEHKIIPAIKSRTQGFHIETLDKEQFLARIANILIAEGVELTEENLEILDEYSITTYPDLRKCINLLQQNCTNGQLNRPSTGSNSGSSEYMVNVVNLFKQNKIMDARKLICANARPEDYEGLYRLLYQNIAWWGSTENQQNQAVVIIANRLRDNAICADLEINMSACLIELSMIE